MVLGIHLPRKNANADTPAANAHAPAPAHARTPASEKSTYYDADDGADTGTGAGPGTGAGTGQGTASGDRDRTTKMNYDADPDTASNRDSGVDVGARRTASPVATSPTSTKRGASLRKRDFGGEKERERERDTDRAPPGGYVADAEKYPAHPDGAGRDDQYQSQYPSQPPPLPSPAYEKNAHADPHADPNATLYTARAPPPLSPRTGNAQRTPQQQQQGRGSRGSTPGASAGYAEEGESDEEAGSTVGPMAGPGRGGARSPTGTGPRERAEREGSGSGSRLYEDRQRAASPTRTQHTQASRAQSDMRSDTGSVRSDGGTRVHGAFAGGAATSGPNAAIAEDVEQADRGTAAESGLSSVAMVKLGKVEAKEAKRLSKVIRSEAKAQKTNLDMAIKELGKLQKVQKQASADESKALSAHASASKDEHKKHTRFLAAKAAHEHAAAELRLRAEGLELARAHAQRQTERLAEKAREVEELRLQKAVDEREREQRLGELAVVGKNN